MKNITFVVMTLALLAFCSCKESEKDELSHEDITSIANIAAEGMKAAMTNNAIIYLRSKPRIPGGNFKRRG